MGEEDVCGTISQGEIASFIALDRDIVEQGGVRFEKTRVGRMWFEGELVFDGDGCCWVRVVVVDIMYCVKHFFSCSNHPHMHFFCAKILHRTSRSPPYFTSSPPPLLLLQHNNLNLIARHLLPPPLLHSLIPPLLPQINAPGLDEIRVAHVICIVCYDGGRIGAFALEAETGIFFVLPCFCISVVSWIGL